jgi:anti-sigma B factor antagonist
MLLHLAVEDHDDHVLVRAQGELDLSSAGRVTAAVKEAFAHGRGSVLVDLSGVTFVDSTGLTALVRIHREAEARGTYVAVVAPSRSVRRVLDLLGLGDVLHVHNTVEQALPHG